MPMALEPSGPTKRFRVLCRDYVTGAGSADCASAWESGARPMALRPLSTYTTDPVTADASGLSRNAAAAPTSLAASSFCTGALAYEYLRVCASC